MAFLGSGMRYFAQLLKKLPAHLVWMMILFVFAAPTSAFAQDGGMNKGGLDQKIDEWLKLPAEWLEAVIFYSIPVTSQQSLPLVLILLAGTAVFLTVYFKFVNVRQLPLAFRTVRGKYSGKNDPGEITHFQALTAALSATVGLGNIAGVAIAVGIGGPGATFWMILMGICGMTTKFCECTLGVKYRKIDENGKAHGGAMYYLQDGLKERGLGGLGRVLAIFFAVVCIGATLGAGNMYQANQAHSQFVTNFGSEFDIGMLSNGYVFGGILAFFVALVIIGGIKSIARVTSVLVPLMCGVYIIAGFVILGSHLEGILPAFGEIISSAFSNEAMTGGFVGVLIQGIRRAAFSNEAGIGSAPIAHAAVKTKKPASEGLVALLEPFTDTVVVCSMTALVIVITGQWKVDAVAKADGIALLDKKEGIEQVVTLAVGDELRLLHTKDKDGWQEAKHLQSETMGWINIDQAKLDEQFEMRLDISKTSAAFGEKITWFPWVLTGAVILFAFSTMISWSYYGEQGLIYLMGRRNPKAVLIYKLVFCGFVVIGAAASLGNVLRVSDALLFAMVIPNMIGLYILLPVVKKEFADFQEHARKVDSGEKTLD